MELHPIPLEIEIERKLPYLVLTIRNNSFWYLFAYLMLGLCWLAVIYAPHQTTFRHPLKQLVGRKNK
jgi:hypothetical protein